MELVKRGKRFLCSALVLLIVLGQLAIVPAHHRAEAGTIHYKDGATYFTDEDNWGGGAANSHADGDLDFGLRNQKNKSGDANDYGRYPVEVKIEGVDQLPVKNAYLLVRGYDVDEYKPDTAASGEWDRVYFSSEPSDIVLGPNYTVFPNTTNWNNSISLGGAGVNGADYRLEIPEASYLGTLSGQDNKWNTSVIPFASNELGRIAMGDNYIGITIHHYYKDLRTSNSSTPNTNWEMTIDWVQLIIDGGSREKAELTEAGLTVENGKVTVDTSFLPKVTGDYAIEVNVVEKVVEDGVVIERNLGINKQLFADSQEDIEKEWKDIVIFDPSISPDKEYVVNIILSEDRGAGISSENYTNPGEVQHLVSLSTHDLVVEDISKSGDRNDSTSFTADDFKDNYRKVSGLAANGANLQHVQIITLPDASKGKLVLDDGDVAVGATINTADLDRLTFIPVPDAFDSTVEFEWNGFNGTKYAENSAIVTIKAVGMTDAESVDLDVQNLVIGYANGEDATKIQSNLTLPAAGANGTTIVWTSSSPAFIDPMTGAVNRPSYSAGDQSVTLEATVTKGNVSRTEAFQLTVKAAHMTDEVSVDLDMQNLVIGYANGEDPTKVQSNLALPAVGANGTKIVWTSSSPAFIDPMTGAVNRPSYSTGNQSVTLEATVTKGNVSRAKTFQLTVIRKDYEGGGGGGGWIPSGDATVEDIKLMIGGNNVLTFTPDQDEYMLETEEDAFEIMVDASHTKALVAINDEIIGGKVKLSLIEGENQLNIVITAENGEENKYTIMINRLKKVSFPDIDNHWAKDYIKTAYRNGWFKGYLDGNFGPDNHLTRMHSASLFVRILGLTERTEVPFTDIRSIGKEATEELEKAYANGVINGYSDQTFKPNANVTRGQLALLFYRTYEKVNGTPYKPNQLANFPDITSHDQETQNAIAMLVELGIAEGSLGKFMPNDEATRAQTAKMLVNFKEVLDRLENK